MPIARQATSMILIDALLWAGWAWAAPPPSSPAPLSDARSARTLEVVERLRSDVDRTAFDLEALLESLDYDVESIVRFVRQEIRFEQYPGLLRGAQGTLMSRAGNSLDQSVLLATLLKDAGDEVRILRASLSLPTARTLLRGLEASGPAVASENGTARTPSSEASAPTTAPPTAQSTVTEPPLIDFEALDDPIRPDAWSPPSPEAIESTLRHIRAALDRHGVVLGDPEARVRLEEEARDYFWVQHRDGPSSRWIDVQPLFASPEEELAGLEANETLLDQVPASLQHRVRIEAFIERKIGDRLEVHSIMNAWERPAANLVGEVVTFGNYPSGATAESLAAGWDAVLEGTTLFVPVLGGHLADGAHAFDRNGAVFALDSLGMDRFGARALFQTVADRTEKAVAAIGALGSAPRSRPEDVMALTAQWLDITVIAPGGEETSYRRYLVDRLGPAARSAGDLGHLAPESRLDALVAAVAVLVDVGTYPREFLKQRLLEQAELNATTGLESQADLERHLEAGFDPLYAAYAMFEQDAGRDADVLMYRSGPGVTMRRVGLGLGTEHHIREVVDIVHHARRFFRISPEGPVATPWHAVRQGIWETYTEGVAVLFDSRSAPEIGARRVLSEAEERKTPLEALTPAMLAREPGRLSADDRAWIAEEHARGFTVLLPETAAGDGQPMAWWRIDAASGRTVGMAAGLGGATVSGYTVVLSFAIGAVLGFMAATVSLLIREPRSRCKQWEGRESNLAEQDGRDCWCVKYERAKVLGIFATFLKWCDATTALLATGCDDGLQCWSEQPGAPLGQLYRDGRKRDEQCRAYNDGDLSDEPGLKACKPDGPSMYPN